MDSPGKISALIDNLKTIKLSWTQIIIGVVLVAVLISTISEYHRYLEQKDAKEKALLEAHVKKEAALKAENEIKTNFLNNIEEHYRSMVVKYKEKKFDGAKSISNLFLKYGKVQYKDVKALSSKIDVEIERKQIKEEKEAAKLARVNVAKKLERKYLSNGMDVRIFLSGPEKTIMLMEYVFMSRPLVYQITNETNFLLDLELLGFKKVIFSDGYDWKWSYNLAK